MAFSHYVNFDTYILGQVRENSTPCTVHTTCLDIGGLFQALEYWLMIEWQRETQEVWHRHLAVAYTVLKEFKKCSKIPLDVCTWKGSIIIFGKVEVFLESQMILQNLPQLLTSKPSWWLSDNGKHKKFGTVT